VVLNSMLGGNEREREGPRNPAFLGYRGELKVVQHEE